MDSDRARLPLLQRREIEARIVGPLVRAFADELGRDRAVDIVAGVIRDLAHEAGADLAREVGERTLEAFAGTLGRWSEGGALEINLIEQTPERLSFDVTRCRYAELYRALGLADLGASLSCQRDYSLAKGFNPDIHLVRTRTIMQGAPTCDFRFRMVPSDGGAIPAPTAIPRSDELPGRNGSTAPRDA